MNKKTGLSVCMSAMSVALVSIGLIACAQTQEKRAQNDMTFFVTSTGSGKGADLGGLAGADKHCQSLATAAGAGNHTWHAYLSTSAAGGQPAVNARDRIGKGPWYNVNGVLVAHDVEQLHGDNNINKQTALTEKGQVVNGRGDNPNRHDMLTGSQANGRAFSGSEDMTCGNWTKSGSDGSAMLGHHDRQGTSGNAMSWNSAHPSKGCDQQGLRSTGGDGLFYCFAVK
jgi:hypothetical protein